MASTCTATPDCGFNVVYRFNYFVYCLPQFDNLCIKFLQNKQPDNQYLPIFKHCYILLPYIPLQLLLTMVGLPSHNLSTTCSNRSLLLISLTTGDKYYNNQSINQLSCTVSSCMTTIITSSSSPYLFPF